MSKNNKKQVIEEKSQNKGGLNWTAFFVWGIHVFLTLFVSITFYFGTLDLSYRKIMAMVVGIMFYFHLEGRKGE